MKKALVILLTLALCVCLFAGCQSGGQTATTTAAATTAATTAAAATAAATTAAATTAAVTTTAVTTTAATTAVDPSTTGTGYPLVSEPLYYSAMNGVTPQNVTGKWDDLMYFTAVGELTNVYFNFANIAATDYDTKMNLSLASGSLYDIYLSGVGADNVRTYGVEGGLFMKLEDLIQENMPQLIARNEEDPRMLKAVTESDGSIYDFPQFVETATIAVATVYTRLDYTEPVGYDEAKINAIKDISEVYDLLKAVQADNADNPDFITLPPRPPPPRPPLLRPPPLRPLLPRPLLPRPPPPQPPPPRLRIASRFAGSARNTAPLMKMLRSRKSSKIVSVLNSN